MSSSIELYTDGASSGNPGPGGYGAILRSGQHYKEISEGFRKTTNYDGIWQFSFMFLANVYTCLCDIIC